MPPRGRKSKEVEVEELISKIRHPESRAAAEEWVFVRSTTDRVGASALKNAAQALLCLSRWLDANHPAMPFQAVTSNQMKLWARDLTRPAHEGGFGYRSTTAAARQIQIKVFYKWVANKSDYENGVIPRPELSEHPATAWIRVRRKDTAVRLQADSILTRDEVLQLIQAADHPRDQALIAVLWDAGFRISEALALNVSGYRRTGDAMGELQLTLPDGGKTEWAERRVVLTDAVPYLEMARLVHPLSDYPDAPLLWSFNSASYISIVKKAQLGRWQRRHKKSLFDPIEKSDLEELRLTSDGARGMLRRLTKRTGIRKKIHPHIFRHSRATFFAAQGVSEPVLRAHFGWSPTSNMPSHYVHLGGKAVDNAILRAQGIEVPDEDSVPLHTRCPVGHAVAPTSVFCPDCGRRVVG